MNFFPARPTSGCDSGVFEYPVATQKRTGKSIAAPPPLFVIVFGEADPPALSVSDIHRKSAASGQISGLLNFPTLSRGAAPGWVSRCAKCRRALEQRFGAYEETTTITSRSRTQTFRGAHAPATGCATSRGHCARTSLRLCENNQPVNARGAPRDRPARRNPPGARLCRASAPHSMGRRLLPWWQSGRWCRRRNRG